MSEPEPPPSPPPGRAAHAPLEAILAEILAQPAELVALLDASATALVAFTADRRIVAANAPAEQLFGHAPGALLGRSTDMLLPPRLRQPAAPPMMPFTDIMQIELSGQRADGTELTVDWILGSVDVGGAPLFVMQLRDHATIERAFEALRASEERFRLLVDGVRDYAIYLLDATGHVSSWNLGAERAKGWTRAEIIGQPYELFFTAEERALGVPQQLLADAVRDGTREVIGWRVRKDGTRFRANANLTALRGSKGELYGFAKITRDLTERLAAEELAHRLSIERAAREAAETAETHLRASEERVRRLQGITAALSEASTPREVASVIIEQSVQALAASGAAIFLATPDGEALELLAERGFPSVFAGAYARVPLTARTPIVNAARTRTATFHDSAAAIKRAYPALSDSIATDQFEAGAALPLTTHGQLIGALGLRFADVREFDATEKSLLVTISDLCAQALERARLFATERDARTAAEATSRAKDQFLAMLGHELRNPLAPIVTALSLLESADAETSVRARGVIGRQVTHLVRMVDDLLDVSRITGEKVQLQRARVEMAQVVARAVELSSPLVEQRRHHLAVTVAAEGLAVIGDATRLAQVVANLLNNSAKYTPLGGRIDLSVRRESARIVLTVRDDGIGIEAGMLSTVFELFAQEHQSLDRSQGGLGLGLTIVRSLVGMHGGTVIAASDGRGRGSTFTMTLPAAPPLAAEPPASPPASVPPAREPPRRILVVDDNLDAADLMGEVLRARGHEVAVAHDGPSALALAAEFRPDLALLDIGLPVMDGYELARRLRTQLGAIKLVALTGYGQANDRARAKDAGFDVHMVKPVQMDALRAALA